MNSIQLVISFLGFLFLSILFFYIPGIVLLRPLKKIHHFSFFSIGLIVGIALFIFISYICTIAGIPLLPIALYTLFYIYIFWSRRYTNIFQNIIFSRLDIFSLLIIGLGTVTLASLSFFSGWQTSNGLQFIGYVNRADGLIHIGYIKQLVYQIPPVHIGLSGVQVKGYHFLYDFFLSRFVLFFHFNPFDLYYRFFPIGILLLYGFSFYEFTNIISKSKKVQRLILFFAYFSYSFAPLLAYFIPFDPTYGFGLTQVTEFIFNPSIILSISMLLTGASLLILEEESYLVAILVGIIFGILPEVKAYAGFAGISMLGGFTLYRFFIKKKNFSLWVSLVISIVIALFIFLPNNAGSVGIIFHPGFMYEQFMRISFFEKFHWGLILTIYQQHHNYPRLFILYTQVIATFWFLSLGIRSIMVLGIVSLLRKDYWFKSYNIILLLLIISPIIFASLFIQSLSVFDTNQFFWISECLLAIPAGLVLGGLLRKASFLVTLFVVILLTLSVGKAYYQTLDTFVFHPFSVSTVTNAQKIFFDNVSKSVANKDQILFVPKTNSNDSKPEFYDGPIVASFTGRAVYLEPESVTQQLFVNTMNQRAKQILYLRRLLVSCKLKDVSDYMKNITHTRFLITQEYMYCPLSPRLQRVVQSGAWELWEAN